MTNENDVKVETALVPTAPPTDLAQVPIEQIEQQAAQIGRRAQALQKLIHGAMVLLKPNDWTDFGGKPYLSGEGAQRFISPCGLSLTAPVFEIDEQGADVFVTCCVTAEWPRMGAAYSATGVANTRDKLWNSDKERSQINQYREAAGGDERLARRMLLGWVKHKAHQNALSRAVCGILGIRGLPWTELQQYGFTADKAASKVVFRKGTSTKAATKTTPAKTECQTVALAAMLELPKGSTVNVGGTLDACKQYKSEGKKGKVVFDIYDGVARATITRWTESDPPEWAVPGAQVWCSGIKIGEYRGSPQYTADSVSLKEGEPNESGE